MKLWSRLSQKRIYADAAAATPLLPAVKAELIRLLDMYGNPSALHKEAVAADEELLRARENVAKTVFAHPDEIIFTAGGTEANNLAIFGVLQNYLKAGEHVHAITSAVEHSSVLEPLRALKEEGLELTELSVDAEGRVDPQAVREAVTPDTVLVSIQMVNSEIGTIQNIREIAKEIRREREKRITPVRALRAARPSPTLTSGDSFLPLYLHTDASQAPLWHSLQVEKLGIDLMTLDAQKMMGPKGAGVLYARRAVVMSPHIYGGGQEGGRRSGTENVPYVGAFAVALSEAQKDVEARAKNIAQVRDYLIDEIKKLIPGAELHGAMGEERAANNVNIYIPNLNGDMAVVALDAEGVAASTRSACDTDEEAPSHVLAALGIPPEKAKNSLRLTLLPTATASEAKQIAAILADIAKRYSQK